jgi:SNF2 family DNA or RNA helicase
MGPGVRVRLRGTGEVGVILGDASTGLLRVAFTSAVQVVPERDVEPLPSEPDEALLSGQLGSVERFGLRLQALYLQHVYRYDPLSGLSSARVEPQLHQVYVAHRVTQKLAPRMILADEVGLGKTIEAGIILKELRARQLVERVLIVCPASLQFQWQQELRSKFNEEFEILDGAAAKHLGKGGVNAFAKVPNVICSLNFAAQPKRLESITETPWDLVIFDEAHRVRRKIAGAKVETTRSYELADTLKDSAMGLLLLTATPMQLSPYELWSHIELVEPGLFPSYADYEQTRRRLPRLNECMRQLQGWEARCASEQAQFVRSAEGSLLRQLAECSEEELRGALASASERERLMDLVVASHPMSQVMVRNRKANVGGFVQRKAQKVPVQLSDHEREVYEAVTEYLREGYNRALVAKNKAIGFLMVTYHKMLASSPAAIHGSLSRRLEKLTRQHRLLGNAPSAKKSSAPLVGELREALELSAALESIDELAIDADGLTDEIEELRALVSGLEDCPDNKAKALVSTVKRLLDEHPDEKVLVFTQFVETQAYLASILEVNGIEAAQFNGRLSLDEKERAVQRFRNDVPVLISTEAGGEGRNFQFAHILFNYDLPWNPMKVEQRIGRIDRIGQKRDVLIYNLYRTDTVEERVLEVLEERIRLFEESVGALDPILGEVEADLEKLVMQQVLSAEDPFAKYTADLDQRVREARALEHTLQDFVLDRASLRRDTANELLNENGPRARAADLQSFLAATVSHWGGTAVPGPEGETVLTLPLDLQRKLHVRTERVAGVFDPQLALELEHHQFLAFGHRVIDNLLGLPIDDDPVMACMQRRHDVPPGTWVEAIYEVTTQGARRAGRLVRHLVGADGAVKAEPLRTMPPVGEPVAQEPPAWVSAALAASWAEGKRSLHRERAAAEEADETAKRERLDRVERIYEHSRMRLERHAAEVRARIDGIQAGGTARQRNILPALEGQVEAGRRRLAELAEHHEREVAQIEAMQSKSTLRLLAASVVVGA